MLSNGKVLVVGGCSDNGCGSASSSAELYDPVKGNWQATGSLNTGRAQHSATLLRSGKVLVSGGCTALPCTTTASAELYDPLTGTWTTTGSMGTVRAFHTATLLADGKVIVTGGNATAFVTGPMKSTELYDPATGNWSPTGSLTNARELHTATLLRNGQVLVVGGRTNSSELYNPATGNWSPTASLNPARSSHAAALLPSGKVLVVGGVDNGNNALSTIAVYDPGSGLFNGGSNLTASRYNHTVTLLPDGQILIAGGCSGNPCTVTNTTELYNATAAGSWRDTNGFLETSRYDHSATLLPDG